MVKEVKEGRVAESQVKAYNLDLQHSEKVLSMQDTNEAEPAKVEEVLEVVTAAKLMTEVVTTTAPITTSAQVPNASAPRKRRGVVIQDPEETPATSVIVHSEVQSKDKGKGILIEEPKPLKNEVIEQVKRKERQDNEVMRYQAFKRKPLTKAQARKNMMIYLKNMVGFKMNFFKGMTYSEIKPLFEKYYNLNQAFLETVEEEVLVKENEIEEEGSKTKGDSLEQKIAKKQRMDEEADELKIHLQIVPNDDDDVYTAATPLASKNFDREYLETLWKLVKESFKSTEPKNFSDDFLINTLKIIFRKPNVEANVWRDQKGIYGLAKNGRTTKIRVGDATVKIRLIGRRDKDGRQHNLPTADEVDALIVEDGYRRDIYLEGITDDTPEDKKSSIHYMLQNNLDAMAMCKWYGYPDLFITFTCNPKWQEITRFLRKRGMKSEDHPDVITKVFKMKLDQLIKDIKDKRIFGYVKPTLCIQKFYINYNLDSVILSIIMFKQSIFGFYLPVVE
nr:putative PIF1 DNA helicase/replication protein A1-like protein [Tanacetum cinerariifolium]